MYFYIFIFIGLAAALLFIKIRSGTVIYIKKLILPSACIIFIAALMLFSKTSVDAAVKGIKLWLDVVFPSLFPFFVASELLNKSGFVKALGVIFEPVMRPLFNIPGCGAYTLLMGITSGYPMGAKITAEMRRDGMLSRREAERLLAFTNNSGPLFILGAVAVGMLNMPVMGFILLGAHILACITVGILFRFYKADEKQKEKIHGKSIIRRFARNLMGDGNASGVKFASVFGDAVRNSVSIMLAIGGFIIFFSVVVNLLIKSGIVDWVSKEISFVLFSAGIYDSIIKSVICGFFEMTTGANMAAGIREIPIVQQMAVISFIIGWAGLSVHSQVISIVKDTDISIKPYLAGKLLQGILAAFYTVIFIKFAGNAPASSNTVFSTYAEHVSKILQGGLKPVWLYWGISGVLLMMCITAAAARQIARNRR